MTSCPPNIETAFVYEYNLVFYCFFEKPHCICTSRLKVSESSMLAKQMYVVPTTTCHGYSKKAKNKLRKQCESMQIESISREINCAEHEYMSPSLIELATPLMNTWTILLGGQLTEVMYEPISNIGLMNCSNCVIDIPLRLIEFTLSLIFITQYHCWMYVYRHSLEISLDVIEMC